MLLKRKYFVRDDKVFSEIWTRRFRSFTGRNSPLPTSSHLSETRYIIPRLIYNANNIAIILWCVISVAKTIYADELKSRCLQAYTRRHAVISLYIVITTVIPFSCRCSYYALVAVVITSSTPGVDKC